jgi:hypothetical protein
MHVVTCHTFNAHQVTKHPSIAGTKHTKKIRYRSADQSDSNFHHYLGVYQTRPDRTNPIGFFIALLERRVG